ncbi:hypothetical protein AOQ84DRAFT_220034 [Glonium stellatum]|uniref:Uncharacterized protein n=1 Tax=Glonium stellatum TaxID=574774 RepID=A0A8E2F519_9PEZI|nr:hypothetical protein AOQ84DRAFT_220034 [Glonium stellatum]
MSNVQDQSSNTITTRDEQERTKIRNLILRVIRKAEDDEDWRADAINTRTGQYVFANAESATFAAQNSFGNATELLHSAVRHVESGRSIPTRFDSVRLKFLITAEQDVDAAPDVDLAWLADTLVKHPHRDITEGRATAADVLSYLAFIYNEEDEFAFRESILTLINNTPHLLEFDMTLLFVLLGVDVVGLEQYLTNLGYEIPAGTIQERGRAAVRSLGGNYRSDISVFRKAARRLRVQL